MDLQDRVFSGKNLIGASKVRYNATALETLNVLLADDAAVNLPSEHETLTETLGRLSPIKLADLQETRERPRIWGTPYFIHGLAARRNKNEYR